MKKAATNIRVLVLNEDENDSGQICAALAKSELAFDVEIASRHGEFVKKLIKLEPDVVVAKPIFNKYTALDIYDDVRKAAPFSYFILIGSSYSKEEMSGFVLSGIDYFLPAASFDLLQFIALQGYNKKHLEKEMYFSHLRILENRQQLRSIFNNDQNAIFIVSYKNEILDLNPAAIEILEKQKTESLIGNDITKYIDRADIKKFRIAHANAFRGKKSSDDFTFTLLSKVARQASINFVPIKDEEGVVTSIIMICKDVTDVILFRQKFKISEDRFMALANNARVGIYYNTPDGKCLFVNKQWLEYSGLSFRESIGNGWLKSVHPDDRKYFEKQTPENSKMHGELAADYRVVHSSGRVYWLRGKSSPFLDEKGKLIGYIGTAIDVTNDKLHEQEIAEANKKLALTIKLAGLGEIQRDFKNLTGKWSDEVYKIFEIEKSAGVPSLDETINQYVHPEDRDYTHHALKNIQPDSDQQQVEYRIITPSGKIKYLKSMFTFEKGEDGKPQKLFSAIKDITESKTMLLQVQDAQRRQKTALELANIALWESDLSDAESAPLWSDNMFTLLEREKNLGSPTNKEFIDRYVHPADREYIHSVFSNYIPGKTSEEIFFRIVTPSGKTKYLCATLTGEMDTEGKPSKILGYVQDITSLLRHETEIKSSEEKFKYLFNNSPDGIYIEDLDGNILEVNDQACNIQGMEKNELIGKNILDLAPETLRAEISKKFTKLAQGEITMLQSFSWDKSGNEIPIQIKQNRIVYNLKPALLLHVRRQEN